MNARSDHPNPGKKHKEAQPKLTAGSALKKLGRWLAQSTCKPDNFPGFLVALFTLFLVVFAYYAWDEATRGTKALQGQLDVLRADQRPWVSLDVKLADGLNYDANGWAAGMRWHTRVAYELKNVGKTPAINADIFGEIAPYVLPHWPQGAVVKEGIPQGAQISGTDMRGEIDGICNFPETMAHLGIGPGQILFPNENRHELFGLNGNPTRFEQAKQPSSGYIGNFFIVICTTYNFVGDNHSHRTAKAFQLFKISGGPKIDLGGETIPIGNLELAPHLMGGSFAD